MDTYKIQINPVDQIGILTTREARVLNVTYLLGETPELIDGATFETIIPANDGSNVVLNNAAHTILEDGVDEELNGIAEITISSALASRIRQGRSVPIMSKVTISTVTRYYWGTIDEVRNPIG